MRFLLFGFATMSIIHSSNSYADYALGCADPEYQNYVEQQLSQYEAKNRRRFEVTLRDYEISLATSSNKFNVIASLSRHLKYSAQFDPLHEVTFKIDRIFEHAEELSVKQQIAGEVFDGFSSETHSVGIARAWIAYRRGNQEAAFEELLKSIDITGSALLSSFGPDFEFIRHIYNEGHVEPVLAYISKTEEFWIGKRADELRNTWRKMINANCKIQFDTIDTIKAVELGLSLVDVSGNFGDR